MAAHYGAPSLYKCPPSAPPPRASCAPPPLDLDNDYKQDRLAIMPNLKRLRESGVHFVNHVAAQPVCGPSRSSLLAGRYPHNVGYYANEDPASVANYLAVANNTVGTWLTAGGYHTAFIGKYVNGVEKQVPSGWNFWGAFSTSKVRAAAKLRAPRGCMLPPPPLTSAATHMPPRKRRAPTITGTPHHLTLPLTALASTPSRPWWTWQ